VPCASSAGNANTPRSSPNAFCIAGSAHIPIHCIATRPCRNAPGSVQSVGAPSNVALLVYSSRSLLKASAARSPVKPGWLSLVRYAPPDDHSAGPPSARPPSLPTKMPLTLSVVSVLAAAIRSSIVWGGWIPALSNRLLR
jgi:hypothetical protein